MADPDSAAPSGAQAAPAAAPAPAPAPVDPNAAALAIFANAAKTATSAAPAPAPDPKAVAEKPPGTAETAAEEPTTPEALKAKSADLARGFGKLATEKAKVLQREQAAKAVEGNAKRWTDAETKVKADPASVLELHGITLEQVAEAYLRRTGEGSQPTVEDRVAQLEAEKAEATKNAETEKTRQGEEARLAAVQTGVNIIKAHLEATPEKFPIVCTKGEHDIVFQAVGQYAVKYSIPFDQVDMDMVTAIATAYEEARQQQVDEEISTLAPKVPRIAARLAPARETPGPSGHTTVPGAEARSVTLASPAASEAPPPRPVGRLTREELDRRALEHFKTGVRPS